MIYGNIVGGGGGSNIELDKTLTIEGTASDAKAVGDALNKKQSKITSGTSAPSGGVDGDVYIQTGAALAIANGGTGATSASGALLNFGVARYVVETGTKNGWDYVKYSDGTAEVWGVFDVTGVATSQAFGEVFRSPSTYSQTFPFTFASAPICLVDISSPNDWALWLITHKNATTITTSTAYVGRASSSTGIPVRFSYYAKGTLA